MIGGCLRHNAMRLLTRFLGLAPSTPEPRQEWTPETIQDLVDRETVFPDGCPQCNTKDLNSRQTCEHCQFLYDHIETVKTGLKPVKKSKRLDVSTVSTSISTLLQNLDLRVWESLIKHRQRAMRQGHRRKLCDQIYLGLFVHGGLSTWKLILEVFRTGDDYPSGLPVNSEHLIDFVTASRQLEDSKALIRSLQRSRNYQFEYLGHCLVSRLPYVTKREGERLWTEYFMHLRKAPVDQGAVDSSRSALQSMIAAGYPPKKSFYVEGSDQALPDASKHGLVEDVTFLTEQGWSAIDERKNFPNYYVSTAIVAACKHGHADVLRVLLSRLEIELSDGRGPNFYFEPADEDGRLAIEFAANAGHADCAIQIIEKWGGENTNRFAELKSVAISCAEKMAQRACADVLSDAKPPWNESVFQLKADFDRALREGNADVVRQLLSQSSSLYGEYTNDGFALITGLSGGERKAAAELYIPQLIEEVAKYPNDDVSVNLSPLKGYTPGSLLAQLKTALANCRSHVPLRESAPPRGAVETLERALVDLGDLEPVPYIVQRLFSSCWEYDKYGGELSMLRRVCEVSILTDALVDLIGEASSFRIHEHHGGEYYSLDTQTGTQAIEQLAAISDPWAGFVLSLAATMSDGTGYIPRGEAVGEGGNAEVSFEERRNTAKRALARRSQSPELDPHHWRPRPISQSVA